MGKPFLLLGPERGKKEDKIKEIISFLNRQTGDEAEIFKFYPFEDSAVDIIGTALNGSLLSSNLVLIIDQAETIKSSDEEFYLEYFKSQNAGATLIFKTEEVSVSRVSSAITKAIGKAETIIFWEMFDSDKRGWLIRYFQDAGMQALPDAVEFILEMLENNTAEFKAICQQIVNFYPQGSRLTAEKLEEYLYHSKEESVFSLFSKIVIGDFQGSLDVLKKLRLGGDLAYPYLMGSILSQFKKLFQWSSMAEERFPADVIATKVGVRSKKGKQEFQKGIALYSHEQIRSIILLTIQTDGRLRETVKDLQPAMMDLYLYAVILRKGEAEDFSTTLDPFAL